MKCRLSWLPIGGVLLALGCGSSSSTGTTAAQACVDVAQARCNEGSTCTLPAGTGGTGFNILENYGDLQTCLTRQTLACVDGLMAPQTGNTPAKVELCVTELASASCQSFFDNQPPTDCSVTGAAANGATCTFNGQCASGYCQGTKTSVCGTCAAPPAAGADCSSSTCAQGQRCVSSTMQCQTVAALNMVCDATHPCDRGLTCFGENATTGTAGTCEAAATQIGQPCGGTMPGCDGTLGLYCGGPSGSKTCMLVVYPTGSAAGGADASADGSTDAGADAGAAGAGAGSATPTGTPCGVLADGSHVGCAAGNCYTATGPASGSDLGTCKASAPDNMHCDTMLGPSCLPPARCVTSAGGTAGTCLVPNASMCPAS